MTKLKWYVYNGGELPIGIKGVRFKNGTEGDEDFREWWPDDPEYDITSYTLGEYLEDECIKKFIYSIDGMHQDLIQSNYGDAREWIRHVVEAYRRLHEGGYVFEDVYLQEMMVECKKLEAYPSYDVQKTLMESISDSYSEYINRDVIPEVKYVRGISNG